jgi:hypothetical protein
MLLVLLSTPSAAPAQSDLNDWPPTFPAEMVGRGGLHLPPRRKVNLTHTMTDGGGFKWDIRTSGTVGRGTNSAYGSGMYLQVGGASVYRKYAWMGESDHELELFDRYSTPRYRYRKGLKVFRRIKAYPDLPLARWLDIFHNPTDKDVEVKVAVYSHIPYGVKQVITPSGDGTIDKDEGWFVTTSGNPRRAPSLLHIVTDDRAAQRPTFKQSGSSLYLRYTLTVPAKGIAVLCHFESQSMSTKSLQQLGRDLRVGRLLSDLSPRYRKLIVNFGRVSMYGNLDLPRSETSDQVVLAGGDPLYGRIANDTFDIQTPYGRLALPAGQVIGMAKPESGPDAPLHVLLADGQILPCRSRRLKLELVLADGGTLRVPLADVRHWSFRIGPRRPLEPPQPVPLAALRSGALVALEPDAASIVFRRDHLRLPLRLTDVRLITPAPPDRPAEPDRLVLLDGTTIEGELVGADIELPLQIGATIEIGRDNLAALVGARDEVPTSAGDRVVLADGTELTGRLPAQEIRLANDDGTSRSVPVGDIRSMKLAKTGTAEVLLTDQQKLAAPLRSGRLEMTIGTGSRVSISLASVRGIHRSRPLPGGPIRGRVAKLVKQLASDQYAQRQKATDQLRKMGKDIVPLLTRHLQIADDPEARHRLKLLLVSHGASTAASRRRDRPSTHPAGRGAIRIEQPALDAIAE